MSLETFFDVSDQVMLFLLAVVVGAGLGIVFDVTRALRVLFPPAKKTFFTAVTDALFCIVFCLSVFVYSVQYGRGQVRIFFFIGALLGFALYILTVGNVIIGIIRSIVTAVARVLRTVYSYIIKPIVNIMCIIYQKENDSFVETNKNDKKSQINLTYLLKKRNKVLYNDKANMS